MIMRKLIKAKGKRLITVEVPEDWYYRIRENAIATEMTISEYVRTAIDWYGEEIRAPNALP